MVRELGCHTPLCIYFFICQRGTWTTTLVFLLEGNHLCCWGCGPHHSSSWLGSCPCIRFGSFSITWIIFSKRFPAAQRIPPSANSLFFSSMKVGGGDPFILIEICILLICFGTLWTLLVQTLKWLIAHEFWSELRTHPSPLCATRLFSFVYYSVSKFRFILTSLGGVPLIATPDEVRDMSKGTICAALKKNEDYCSHTDPSSSKEEVSCYKCVQVFPLIETRLTLSVPACCWLSLHLYHTQRWKSDFRAITFVSLSLDPEDALGDSGLTIPVNIGIHKTSTQLAVMNSTLPVWTLCSAATARPTQCFLL